MPKRMLIDASHPEETRVVVLDGQKVEEFDFEAAIQAAAQRQHLSRQGDARRTVAAGGVRRIWRQPPGLPRLFGNPSRLLPDPDGRPSGADRRAGGRSAPPLRRRHRSPSKSRPDQSPKIDGRRGRSRRRSCDEAESEGARRDRRPATLDALPTEDGAEAGTSARSRTPTSARKSSSIAAPQRRRRRS